MSAIQDLQVKHVDTDRCSSGYAYGTVLFIIDNAYGVTYADARDALLRHVFDFEDDRGRKGTTNVDTLRLNSKNDCCWDGSPLKIEAHLKEVNSRSSLQCTLKYIKSRIWGHYCQVGLTFEERKQPVYAKLISTIPPRPVYNYYTITDMPLGEPDLIKMDLGCAIREALPDFLQKKAPTNQYHPLWI